MSDTRFGGSTGLLQRLRPTRIGVADLREVAEQVLPALATPRLRLGVVARSGAGSVVVLEEDERRVRVHLGELADEMTRAGVPATPAGMRRALTSWVAHRPVTDAAAAAQGVAVLDWADARERAVVWRVVVCRGQLARPWTPSSSGAAVDGTRTAAARRAGNVALDLRVEGPVALWSHPAVPVLATAALASPERMLEQIVRAGLPTSDVHAVVTPHRPLACAGGGIAARLAGESTEASVTLAWPDVATLPWA